MRIKLLLWLVFQHITCTRLLRRDSLLIFHHQSTFVIIIMKVISRKKSCNHYWTTTVHERLVFKICRTICNQVNVTQNVSKSHNKYDTYEVFMYKKISCVRALSYLLCLHIVWIKTALTPVHASMGKKMSNFPILLWCKCTKWIYINIYK